MTRQVVSVVVLAGVALGCVGCSGVDRDIRARDYRAVLPNFRAVIDLREPDDRPNHGSVALEIDANGVDGKYSDSGASLGDYRLGEVVVAARLGRVVRDRIHFDGIFGLSYSRLQLKENSGPMPVDDKTSEVGFRVGGQFRFDIVEPLALHARVSGDVRPFDRFATQAEIGLLFRPFREAGVLVGWKTWRYRDENSDIRGIDDLDLRVEGLFLGMELSF